MLFPDACRVSIARGKVNHNPENVRGSVSGFSAKSRRRLLFASFNAWCEWFAFITLTYPADFPCDGLVVRKHRDNFLHRLCREHPGINYLWALEFQERGAPHFHLLVDRFVDLRWLSVAWFEVVGSADEKHLRAGTSVQLVSCRKQGGAYMAKSYSSKIEQKEVPADYLSVGRFWGSSRDLVVAIRAQAFDDVSEMQGTMRALRKFVEKSLRPKKSQPEREGVKRKRKVKRKRTSFLHRGLQGFTIYGGAKIAERLLDGQ